MKGKKIVFISRHGRPPNAGPNTFFEENAVHVDMSRPYCPALRYSLAEAALSLGQ
jgi:purine nucleoside phosphorylase